MSCQSHQTLELFHQIVTLSMVIQAERIIPSLNSASRLSNDVGLLECAWIYISIALF